MVSSISSGAINTGQVMPMQSSSLSDEQLSVISETLSELDADNLSEAEALTIVEAFSEAGIEPGKALESALSDLGFDAKQIGELAGAEGNRSAGGPPPPPPQQSSDEISEMVSFLEQLLEEKLAESDTSELSEQDKEAIYAKVLEQFSSNDGQSLINTSV